MIDPDYIRPFALCAPARRVPYASPLPSRQSGTQLRQGCVGQAVPQPRLPGKPVQNMPPSPHRQGRRGNEPQCVPVIAREEMDGPLIVLSISFFAVVAVLGFLTWGMGVLLAPLLAAMFGWLGVRWSATCGRVTAGQALLFNLQMCGAVFAVPAIWVWSQHEAELAMWFAGLFVVTLIFGAAGSTLATLGTNRPRKALLGI